MSYLEFVCLVGWSRYLIRIADKKTYMIRLWLLWLMKLSRAIIALSLLMARLEPERPTQCKGKEEKMGYDCSQELRLGDVSST